jgi:hypothetical protein
MVAVSGERGRSQKGVVGVVGSWSRYRVKRAVTSLCVRGVPHSFSACAAWRQHKFKNTRHIGQTHRRLQTAAPSVDLSVRGRPNIGEPSVRVFVPAVLGTRALRRGRSTAGVAQPLLRRRRESVMRQSPLSQATRLGRRDGQVFGRRRAEESIRVFLDQPVMSVKRRVCRCHRLRAPL